MNKDKPLKERVLEGTDKSCNDFKPGISDLIKKIILTLVLIAAFTIKAQANYSPDKSDYNMGMEQNYSINQQYKLKPLYEIPPCDSSVYLK